LKYRVFVSKDDGRIRGYIVIRKPHPAELSIGHIVDFYAAKNDIDTINKLIVFAINFFGTSVAAIKCATSLKQLEKLLTKYGFISVETIRPLVFVPDPANKERIMNMKEEWYMTLADQDLDQIVSNLDLNRNKRE
jgi:hypothetical protein